MRVIIGALIMAGLLDGTAPAKAQDAKPQFYSTPKMDSLPAEFADEAKRYAELYNSGKITERRYMEWATMFYDRVFDKMGNAKMNLAPTPDPPAPLAPGDFK